MASLRVALAVLVLAATALTACSQPGAVPTPSFPSAGADPTGTASAPSAPAPSPPAPSPPAPVAAAAPSAPPQPPAAPPAVAAAPAITPHEVIRTDFGALTAVRVGRHPGFDRVVFEFGTTVPGYRIRYVPLPVKADGSGADVPLPGARAALQITFTPASGFDTRATPPVQTYAGPTRIAGAQTVQVTDVARSSDVDAVLSWAAGLRTQVPFTVTTLAAPPRVVIDLQHRP